MVQPNISVDLLVIGGGITGAGIAQDAASRGIKTALVEKGDFAGGTSSRSSKLVHGGLRYLEHLRIGLMRESISERHILTRLAPGLVRWSPFLIPYFAGREKRRLYTVGLWLYDHLSRTPLQLRSRRLDTAGALACCPDLRADSLRGGSLFYDCVTDDARLTLEVMLDARSRGAKVFNYVEAAELIRENGKAAGAVVRDVLCGEMWEIRARQVVIATGPWTDQTLAKFGERTETRKIRPAKGVHIVLPRSRLEVAHTVLIPSVRDRRFLFVIPWYQGIVVGTTDTEYLGDPEGVRVERDDVEYILEALNWAFPKTRISIEDILSSYAGVRPLVNAPGKRTQDVPREHKIFESDSGILSVAGGKLTTYRLMAKKVVARVARSLTAQDRDMLLLPSWSHRICLGRLQQDAADPLRKTDLPEDVRSHLQADYGAWARQIASILEVYPEWSRRMVPGLPHILAEAYLAVTQEMARTLEDILSRRTRIALLDPDQGRSCLEDVCAVAAKGLNWGPAEIRRQVDAFERALCEKYRRPRDIR